MDNLIEKEILNMTEGEIPNHLRDVRSAISMDTESRGIRRERICQTFVIIKSIKFLIHSLSWTPKGLLLMYKYSRVIRGIRREANDELEIYLKQYFKYLTSNNKHAYVPIPSPNFHGFMNLPPELRAAVLEHVEGPADKVSTIRSVAGADSLMKWDLNMLKLEMVLGILLKQQVLSWEDVCNLNRTDLRIRDVLVTDYEKALTGEPNSGFWKKESDMIDKPVDWTVVLPSFPDLSPFQMNPIFRGISYGVMPGLIPTEGKEMFFSRIWDCHIIAENVDHRDAFEFICDLLEVTRLRISGHGWPDDSNGQANDIAWMELPDLPKLKHLQLESLHGICGAIIGKRLRTKYIGGLKQIDVSPLHPPANEAITAVLKLTVINIRNPVGNLKGCMQLLKEVVGAPLKEIRLNFEETDDATEIFNFSELMSLINHFGNTLEILTLYLDFGEKRLKPKNYRRDQSWMSDLNFPKLKLFALDTYPGNWTFLLRFPSLVYLFIYSDKKGPAGFFKMSPIIKMSWDKEGMVRSNIWNLLSCLRFIYLYK